MQFEDAIKIYTNEPDIVIARLGMGSSYTSRSEILGAVAEGLGFTSRAALRAEHPYFNRTSLADSFDLALAPLSEGNNETGYKLLPTHTSYFPFMDLAFQTVVATGISLDHAFGGNRSAHSVAEILFSIRDGKQKRIQDICNETGIDERVPNKHLTRLAELNVLTFQGYDAPHYSLHPRVTSMDIITKTLSPLSTYHKGRAHEIACRLFTHEKKDYDLLNVERLIGDIYAVGGSNTGTTAGALRLLQRLELVQVSNGFFRGVSQTKVQGIFDEHGHNPLIDLVVAVKKNEPIPAPLASWGQAKSALAIFDLFYTRRSTPVERKNQILAYLSTVPGATRAQITKEIGAAGLYRYLKDLESTGDITHSVTPQRTHIYSRA